MSKGAASTSSAVTADDDGPFGSVRCMTSFGPRGHAADWKKKVLADKEMSDKKAAQLSPIKPMATATATAAPSTFWYRVRCLVILALIAHLVILAYRAPFTTAPGLFEQKDAQQAFTTAPSLFVPHELMLELGYREAPLSLPSRATGE